MKFVLTSMLLAFLIISCKKESSVSTGTTTDSTQINTNDTIGTVIPPVSDSATTGTEGMPQTTTDTAATKTSR